MTRNRYGGWIRTFSGKQVYPFDPDVSMIAIEDIGWALSCIPRFNGHTREPYSVAQHSVMVAMYSPKQHRLHALLHDASEAYLCDIPSPLKPYFAGYQAFEEKLQATIYKRFSLYPQIPEEVHDVDRKMLVTEMHTLTKTPVDIKEGYQLSIDCWTQGKSYLAFMLMFYQLMKNTAKVV